jgi:hypothetical protein
MLSHRGNVEWSLPTARKHAMDAVRKGHATAVIERVGDGEVQARFDRAG